MASCSVSCLFLCWGPGLQKARGRHKALKGLIRHFKSPLRAFIRPLKGLIRALKGLINPFKGLIRHFKGTPPTNENRDGLRCESRASLELAVDTQLVDKTFSKGAG